MVLVSSEHLHLSIYSCSTFLHPPTKMNHHGDGDDADSGGDGGGSCSGSFLLLASKVQK